MIRGEAPVLLAITQGKRGWPPLAELPEEPRAWADTWPKVALGAALILAVLAAWAVVLR